MPSFGGFTANDAGGVDQAAVDIGANNFTLRATSSIMKFPGFLVAHQGGALSENKEPSNGSEDDGKSELLVINEDDVLQPGEIAPSNILLSSRRALRKARSSKS